MSFLQGPYLPQPRNVISWERENRAELSLFTLIRSEVSGGGPSSLSGGGVRRGPSCGSPGMVLWMWTDTGYDDGVYRLSRNAPTSFTCTSPQAVWLSPAALPRWGNPRHECPRRGRGQQECLVLGRDWGQRESQAPDDKGSSTQLRRQSPGGHLKPMLPELFLCFSLEKLEISIFT